MDRAIAEKLMVIYARVGEVLNEAGEIARTISGEEERKLTLRPIGDMMARVWTDLQLPIVRQYRDLDPDGDRYNNG